MKRHLVGSICCTATILCALSLFAQAGAETSADTAVDIELVIAADVSLSMDHEEKRLQQEGFVEAFRDPDVVAAIRSGAMGRIAVIYFEWGGENRHRIVVPWTVIDGYESAEQFARRLENNRPARFNRGTSLASALLHARKLLQERGGSATRRVINISGDGRDNGQLELSQARSLTLAADVTINGLPIVYKGLLEGIVSGTTEREVDPRLLTIYFERQVIGGQFAFVEPVVTRENYIDAIRRKLIREIRAPMLAGLDPESGH